MTGDGGEQEHLPRQRRRSSGALPAQIPQIVREPRVSIAHVSHKKDDLERQPSLVALRICQFLALCVIAAVLGALAFTFVNTANVNAFESDYNLAVSLLSAGLHSIVTELQDSAITVATSFQIPPGGLVVFPELETFADSLLHLVPGARAATIMPFVYTTAELDALASFVNSTLRERYCAAGYMCPYENLTETARATLERNVARGAWQLFENGTTGKYTVKGDALRVPNDTHLGANFPAFWMPITQISPLLDPDTKGPNWPGLLYDSFSEPVRHNAVMRMLTSNAPATTDIIVLAIDVQLPIPRPGGAVYAPVYWVENGARTLTGAVTVAFNWDSGIRVSTPGTVRGIHVVIRTASSVFTVFVSEGKSTNLGFVDAHDRAFDRYMRNITVATGDEFPFTFQVTPSAAYHDRFEVLDPVAACASVVAIIVGVTVLSAANDLLTRRRMAQLRAQAGEEKTRRELIGRLTAATTESDVVRAAVAALQQLFPDAVAGALGVFGEGNGTEVLESCHVFAQTEAGRKALLHSLPGSVGGTLASSSIRFVCGDSALSGAADSRDFARGLSQFDDWRAAAQGGLRSAVAISAAVAAGPQVVGFVQMHLGRSIYGHGAPRGGGAALGELCAAVGEAVFVRRAFAIARGTDTDGGPDGTGRAGGGKGGPGRGRSASTAGNPNAAIGLLSFESARRRHTASAISTDSERSGASSVRRSDRGDTVHSGELSSADMEALSSLDSEADSARQDLLDWDLDCWLLTDARCKRLITHMFHSAGLLRRFSISPTTFGAFLDDVAGHYYENPFHCFRHAFTVVHTAWRFTALSQLMRRHLVQDLDVLALLLSALCHDLEHPGTTNAFQLNTGTELALLYNDTHVLENHHCSVAFRLLAANGVLAGLSKVEQKTLRKAVVEAIINTDMAMHKELLGRMERRVALDTAPLSAASDEDRLLLTTFLMHVADLCTPTLPPAVSKRVACRLGEEFEAQAHMERAAQLNVSVMLAATDKAKAQMEAGFITFVVRPLYAMLVKAVPDLNVFLERVDANLSMWKALAAADSRGTSTNNSGRAEVLGGHQPAMAAAAAHHSAPAGGGQGHTHGAAQQPQQPAAIAEEV